MPASKLHITVHVTDTYLGTLSVVLGFKSHTVSVDMKSYAQRLAETALPPEQEK